MAHWPEPFEVSVRGGKYYDVTVKDLSPEFLAHIVHPDRPLLPAHLNASLWKTIVRRHLLGNTKPDGRVAILLDDLGIDLDDEHAVETLIDDLKRLFRTRFFSPRDQYKEPMHLITYYSVRHPEPGEVVLLLNQSVLNTLQPC